MKRFLLFLLFFSISLNANNDIIDISLKNNIPLDYSFKVSADVKNIEEAIANPSKFKSYKYLKRYLRKNFSSNTWFKFDVINTSNSNLNRYIITKWENVNIDIYLVRDKKIFAKSSLKEHNNFLLSSLFTIKPKQEVEIYINVRIDKGIDNISYLYMVSQDSLLDFITQKEIFNHGILLGLLIAMMMYNFFMYFSMKIKSYLYLSIYQFLIIFYVSSLHNYLILLFSSYPYFSHFFINIIIPILIFVFSILFTKEFLNTKKDLPNINKLLNLAIALNIIFQFFDIRYINIATSFSYLVYLTAGFYLLRQGNRFALFFILGFVPTILFYITTSFIRVFHLDFYIEYESMVQILAVIEAFSLSMALYLKLKQTVDEKEKAQNELHQKEKILLEQSRFATMGEMLGSISHQWKQPLNHINLAFGNFLLAYDNNKLSRDYVDKKRQEINEQLKYMSSTIEDFNSFLSNKEELEEFSVEDVCQKAIILTKSRIIKLNVNVQLVAKRDIVYVGAKNGLLQVLLIVLNNSLDALMLNYKEIRSIVIKIDGHTIYIEDNAGGIPTEILPKIFDAYFSTKDKKFGTGMGLYTAKIIMENIIKGSIIAQNIDDGARFILKI